MSGYIVEWLHLALRWFHVVAAITWVGSSFYFNRIDRSFRAPEPPLKGVSGELWSIHGGAIYNYRRYPLGPGHVPARLKWSKYESLGTWLSGAFLLAVVYWYGASLNLVAGGGEGLSAGQAILLSLASLVLGWVIYDLMCRLIDNETVLFAALAVVFSAATWGFFQVFSGKAAFLHTGIVMGTIMAGNVWFSILPGQRRMLKAIEDGTIEQFDVGAQAKKRNYHNNYLTLPVLFAMIAAHFPMTYSSDLGWIAFILISASGVSVRHFFNTMHHGHARPGYIALGAAFFVAAAVLVAPAGRPAAPADGGALVYGDIKPILDQRCAVCHAANPTEEGFDAPPKGLRLDGAQLAADAAPMILLQSVQGDAMPPGNWTEMTEEERATIGRWIDGGARVE
ncbi:urate hydroxylase PuuD [Oceanibium sediminis]|uniref:urate hydroxylase PuuD n=1 Tax=Oceanibium sediminis TaxID=2026339 RepID=UPI000DD45C54|nr:urate hydroxylase PuuD [Oceanibium sediminis]